MLTTATYIRPIPLISYLSWCVLFLGLIEVACELVDLSQRHLARTNCVFVCRTEQGHHNHAKTQSKNPYILKDAKLQFHLLKAASSAASMHAQKHALKLKAMPA